MEDLINKIIEFGFACKRCGKAENTEDIDLITDSEDEASERFKDVLESLNRGKKDD